MGLLDKLKHYIDSNSLIAPDDKVLLTVSGGVDSMVMLRLFVEAGFNVGVAHCNFCLRGEESEQDEVAVEQEALRLGVPFYNRRFDVLSEIERTGESTQMVARRLRYDWFNDLCIEHGYNAIAIAHHADDSIETFFINLLRGTGLKGLTGIHKVNGNIIRPLLFASRKDILEYAHTNKVHYREDSSNNSTKYLRNKIRLGLIPRIREINSKFTDLMSGNIRRLTDAQKFIDRSIEIIRSEVEHREGETVIIDPSKIDYHYPVNYVIYAILSLGYGFKGDVVDDLCRALTHNVSGKRFYARDYVAYVDRGRIIVEKIGEEDSCAVVVESATNRIYCGNSMLFLEHIDIDNIDSLQVPDNIALIDADKVTMPLEVRRWREGDEFVPFGMEGHKKVSDYLINAKVSLADKARQFVLVDASGQIIWLIGRRISDSFKIEKKTETVLRIIREQL